MDFSILDQVKKKINKNDSRLLNLQNEYMQQTQPLRGLKIIHNIPLTLSTLTKIEPLLRSGAEVTLTVSPTLPKHQEALDLYCQAGGHYVPYHEITDDYDIAFDCCAELMDVITPRLGAIELTQTGSKKYANAQLSYPVISIDDSQIKKIETFFGTGDGFVRGFHKLTKVGLHQKRVVVFGAGNVGSGIIRCLQQFTPHLTVIEANQSKLDQLAHDGIEALHIEDRGHVLKSMNAADIVVTASGVKHLMSNYFTEQELTAPFLANMGAEDEWGPNFSKERILYHKVPVNFSLEQPTQMVFLDPAFYAHNIAYEQFLDKNLAPGFYAFDAKKDLEILSLWIQNYYKYSFNYSFLQQIITHLPSFVYWKNRDSVYLGCNDNFARAAGLEGPAEIVGKTDYDLPWGDAQGASFRQGDLQVFAGHSLLNFEEPQLQADGKLRTVLASKVPLTDEESSVIGVLGIYNDITEIKETQLALQRAKDRAEIANESKTQFLSVVSHELRIPLSGILGCAELLKSENLTETQQKYTDSILEVGQHLLSIINDILDFSKIEAKQLRLANDVFSLSHVLKELSHTVEPLAHKKDLSFQCVYPDQKDDHFFGDSVALKQILLNIVGNAIKFTDKGFVKMSSQILTNDAQAENCCIRFCIEDSGPGIAEDKQSLIFDRFQQVDTSITRKYGGTGLGLSIAKGLIDLLDGSIYLESLVNEGTKFFIEIPLRRAVNEWHLQPFVHDIQELAATDDQQRIRARILIVEDDKIIQMVYQSLLHKLNCQVSIVDSGLAALNLLKQQEFDLILSDIGLPDISGLDLAKKYQAFAKHKAPIIAVTGYGDLQNYDELVKCGITDVFVKPISKQILEELLDKYVSKNGSQAICVGARA